MKYILGLYFLLILSLGVLVERSEATTQVVPGERLLVVGDSIAGGSDYLEPWAWFNAVAAGGGYDLARHSFPGTGFAQKPPSCELAFHSRWHLIADEAPDVMVVQDAIGAVGWCSPSTYYTQSQSQVFTNVDNSMRELALEWSRAGNTDRSKVVVMIVTSHQIRGYDWVGDRIEQRAAIHGFTFIRPYLTVHDTTDGIHPDQSGHQVLTDAVNAVL